MNIKKNHCSPDKNIYKTTSFCGSVSSTCLLTLSLWFQVSLVQMCLSNYLLYPSWSYKCWTSLGVDNWSSSSQLLHFMYVKVPKRAAVSLPNTSKNLKGEKHLSGLWKVLAARQPVQEFYTSTTALLVMLMLLSLKNGDLLNYLEF